MFPLAEKAYLAEHPLSSVEIARERRKQARSLLRYVQFPQEEGIRATHLEIMKIINNGIGTIAEKLREAEKKLGLKKTIFEMSMPVEHDSEELTPIDCFVSYASRDGNAVKRMKTLFDLSDEVFAATGKYPKFWIDVYCVDQKRCNTDSDNFEQTSLFSELVPFWILSCKTFLRFQSLQYPTRLWCLYEVGLFSLQTKNMFYRVNFDQEDGSISSSVSIDDAEWKGNHNDLSIRQQIRSHKLQDQFLEECLRNSASIDNLVTILKNLSSTTISKI